MLISSPPQYCFKKTHVLYQRRTSVGKQINKINWFALLGG